MAVSVDVAYRCHRCGQGWKFQQTDSFNNRVPTSGLACPICGTRTCTKSASVMGTEEALAFKDTGAPHQLVQIIYQLWRIDPNPGERFIDFLTDKLAEPVADEE